MYQQGKDLWDWIQEGAHIYVFGDKEEWPRLSTPHSKKLQKNTGNFSPDNALAFVRSLRTQIRYLLDVY